VDTDPSEVAGADEARNDLENEVQERVQAEGREEKLTEADADWLSRTELSEDGDGGSEAGLLDAEDDAEPGIQLELVEANPDTTEDGPQMMLEEEFNEEYQDVRKISNGNESMDIENHNDSSQIEQIKPWEIFRGTIKFSNLKKTVPEVKLIAVSSMSSLSNFPDFNREAVIIEEQLLPREFEREVERLKTKVLKQEMLVVSGFVYTNSNMNKMLSEIRKARSSVYYTNIREGIRLYLIGPTEVSSSAKFMFDDFSELERINCEFLWLLVFENKGDLKKKMKPKLFSSAINYRGIPEKVVTAPTRHAPNDAARSNISNKHINDKHVPSLMHSERAA
jgi:hypothetical protein